MTMIYNAIQGHVEERAMLEYCGADVNFKYSLAPQWIW